jgi:hypothetical protein
MNIFGCNVGEAPSHIWESLCTINESVTKIGKLLRIDLKGS